MSIRIDRDPTGSMFRLECDECKRVSTIWLVGRSGRIEAIRDWLRKMCREIGWSAPPSSEEGQDARVDLCRKCTRKLEKRP
jgi:hypothetical protein